MRVLPTSLPGVFVVAPQIHRDGRGLFCESWRLDHFGQAGLGDTWVQINFCRSRKGVVRGLHLQDHRAPQVRLVQCTHGAVWDVVVDVRVDSPTRGRHVAMELTGDNLLQVRVPEGFAHGFLALTDEAEVRYLCSSPWCPQAEQAIRWDDPDLAIPWPVAAPIVSDRDRGARSFREWCGAGWPHGH